MAWDNPRGDLRLLLNDDPDGNQIKQKRVFPPRGGDADGSTSTFFTLEDRLVASGNQAASTQKLRVFTGSSTQALTEVAASGITVTDSLRGEFQLMGLAPSGVSLWGAYFYREWLDADLDFCLQQAAQQVNASDTSTVQPALELACMNIAASLAHRKAAARWQQRKSEQFLLEDSPTQAEVDARVVFHNQQAAELMTQGLELRRSFYDLRMDKGRAPAYGLLSRQPGPWTPKY